MWGKLLKRSFPHALLINFTVGDDVLGVPKRKKVIANNRGRFVNRPYE